MAELLVVAAAAGGSYLGATIATTAGFAASVGASIGWVLGASLGNALFIHNDQEGPRLSDTRVQTTTYGANINMTWGSTRLSGNIIWAPPIAENKDSKKVGSFLGTGIGGSTVTTYTYSGNFAIGVCEGPISHIRRIWADGKLIFSRMNAAENVSPGFPIRIYKGTETQRPDPLMKKWADDNEFFSPGYRGLCYVVFENMPLADYGNRIPQLSFEVVRGVAGCDLFDEYAVDDLVPPDPYFASWTLADSGTLTQRAKAGHHFPKLQRSVFGSVSDDGRIAVLFYDTSSYPPKLIKSIDASDYALGSPSSWATARLTCCHGGYCATEVPPDGFGSEAYFSTSGQNLFFMLLIANSKNYIVTVNAQSMAVADTLEIENLQGTPYGPWTGYNDDLYYPYDRVAMRWDARNLTLHVQESWTNKGFSINYAGWPRTLPFRIRDSLPPGSSVVNFREIGLTRSDGASYTWQINRRVVLLDGLNHENFWLDIPLYNEKFQYSVCWNGWSTGPAFCVWEFGTGTSYDIGVVANITTYIDLNGGEHDLPSSVLYTIHNGIAWDSKRERIVAANAWNIYVWTPGQSSLSLLRTLSIVDDFLPYFEDEWQSWFGSFISSSCRINSVVYFEEFDAVGITLMFDSDDHIVTFLLDPESGEIIDGGCYYNGPGNRMFGPMTHPIANSSYAITGGAGDGSIFAIPFTKTLSASKIKLYEIVDDVSERMGVTAAHRDTSQLVDDVWGFQVGKPMTGRTAIEQLQAPYFFDPVESGEKMKFVRRGGAIAATIPGEHLCVVEDENNAQPLLSIKRAMEQDLPRRITFRFADPARAYDMNATYSERLETETVNDVVFDLPVVMDADEAQSRCESMLFESWMARTSFSFSTSTRWTFLEPSDAVEITSENDVLYRIRIVRKTEHGAGGSINWEGVEEDDGLFSRPYIENLAVPAQPQTISNTSIAQLFIMDAPLLEYRDPESPLLLAAVNGARPGGNYVGANLFASLDNVVFTNVGAMGDGATIGFANSVLPSLSNDANDPCCLDTLDVVLHHGTLSNITWAQLLNGANRAWVGGEVIQFQRATKTAEGAYTLSGILRARGGTDDFTSTHQIGEDFVLLDDAAYPLAPPSYEPNIYYAAVTIGGSVIIAQRIFVSTARRHALPLSPAELRVGLNDDGDIVVLWTRRDRRGMAWNDGTDAPNSDPTEFVISIGSSDFTSVVREITVTQESYTYLNSEWTSDFATSPLAADGVGISVSQVSASVGRGTTSRTVFVP